MTSGVRSGWVGYIQARKERYLLLRGASFLAHGTIIEEAALEELLTRLGDKQAEMSKVLSAIFLSQVSVSDLVTRELHQLTREMNRMPDRLERLGYGRIEGRISWPSTFKQRLKYAGDPSIFVFTDSKFSFDLPENQILKIYATQVLRMCDGLAKEVGTGALPNHLLELKHHSEAFLKNRRIIEVTNQKKTNSLMRQRARRSRDPRYRLVAEHLNIMEELQSTSRLHQLLTLFSSGYLQPIDDDDVFEVFVLFRVLEIFEDDLGLGQPSEYGLVAANRSYIARWHLSDGTEIKVFFDVSPESTFGKGSVYKNVVSFYSGVTFRPHRPDIILEAHQADGTRNVVFLEMKATWAPAYRGKSIYKAFGYVYDYANTFLDSSPGVPKVILVFPSGMELVVPSEPESEIAISSATNPTRLRHLICTALGL